MSAKQAAAFNRATRTYLGRDAKAITTARIESAGLLLPLASAWALFASAHLAWHLVHDYRWSYRFDLVVTDRADAYRFVYAHVGAYLILVFLLGAIGLGRWRSTHRNEAETHDLASGLGLLIAMVTMPTYLMTLPLLGASIGAVLLANVVSVLVGGGPLRLSRSRRQRPHRADVAWHPRIEDVP